MLLGDDNFLNLAAFDLLFKSIRPPPKKIRQSGFCVSGLTISKAKQKILEMDELREQTIIINVGSVDIAEGSQLIMMIQDFIGLLNACAEKSIVPIVTTLAPMPNYKLGNKAENLNGFNDFIRQNISRRYSVIDLNLCMLQSDDEVNMNLYQAKPRYISGSKKSLLMWNKLGRRRVQNMLKRNLGLALVYGGKFIGKYF